MPADPTEPELQDPTDTGRASDGASGIGTKVALGLALLVGLAYWIARGPMRAVDRLIDFPTFYSASRAWLRGENPYDGQLLQSVFEAAGGGDQTVLLSVNPPGLFPLVALLSALPYRAAQWLVIVLSILALIGTALLIAHLANIPRKSARFVLLVLGCLLLAPIHTSISQGQLTLLTGLGLTLALWGELNRKDVLIGLALAVAVSLKPQMVILFAPYYLLQRRWRVCIAGLAGTFGLLALSIGWMMINGIDWLSSLTGNLDALTQSAVTGPDATGTGNLQMLGHGRYIMTNLAPLIYEFTDQRWLVTAIVWLPILSCLFVLTRWMPRRISQPQQGLCLYACLSLLCLLTFYNRVYCLSIVLLVIGWLLACATTMNRWQRIAGVLLLCPLALPGPALLLVLERGVLSDGWVAQSWLWHYLLLPHWIYLQVGLLGLLLYWGSKHRDTAFFDESQRSNKPI